MVNTWRNTNYIEAQRMQKNDMPQRHNKERNMQSSNQKIPIEPTKQEILQATRIKDIMIRAKKCSIETREAPHDLCII